MKITAQPLSTVSLFRLEELNHQPASYSLKLNGVIYIYIYIFMARLLKRPFAPRPETDLSTPSPATASPQKTFYSQARDGSFHPQPSNRLSSKDLLFPGPRRIFPPPARRARLLRIRIRPRSETDLRDGSFHLQRSEREEENPGPRRISEKIFPPPTQRPPLLGIGNYLGPRRIFPPRA